MHEQPHNHGRIHADDQSGPAFPSHSLSARGGLTRREYFAGRIFAAMLGNGELVGQVLVAPDTMPVVVASAAVKAADALLDALAK